MATTYQKADEVDIEAGSMLRALVTERRQDLVSCKATIELLFAFSDKPGKPAIKKRGRARAGWCKINNLEDRAQGKKDVTICLDGDRWEKWSYRKREALLVHEITHIAVWTNDDGYDDLGRPALGTQEGDWDFDGFHEVLREYGTDSAEYSCINAIVQEHRQLDLPFGIAPRKEFVEAAKEVFGDAFEGVQGQTVVINGDKLPGANRPHNSAPGWRDKHLYDLACDLTQVRDDDDDARLQIVEWTQRVHEALELPDVIESTAGDLVDWLLADESRDLSQLIPPDPLGTCLLLRDVLTDLWRHDTELQAAIPGARISAVLDLPPGQPASTVGHNLGCGAISDPVPEPTDAPDTPVDHDAWRAIKLADVPSFPAEAMVKLAEAGITTAGEWADADAGEGDFGISLEAENGGIDALSNLVLPMLPRCSICGWRDEDFYVRKAGEDLDNFVPNVNPPLCLDCEPYKDGPPAVDAIEAEEPTSYLKPPELQARPLKDAAKQRERLQKAQASAQAVLDAKEAAYRSKAAQWLPEAAEEREGYMSQLQVLRNQVASAKGQVQLLDREIGKLTAEIDRAAADKAAKKAAPKKPKAKPAPQLGASA